MTITWTQLRSKMGELAQDNQERAGIPIPVECARLVVAKGHPYYDRLNGMRLDDLNPTQPSERVVIINSWSDRKNRCDIVIYEDAKGQRFGVRVPNGPMQRFRAMFDCMWIAQTIDIEAERRAMKTLSGLIPKHLFECYELTGTFLETSKQSGVTYVFRRLATTLAMRAAGDDSKFLAALCLHPIAYYESLPMGAMVPTDDVIAHLVMMRSDEPLFWRKANQHGMYSQGAQL